MPAMCGTVNAIRATIQKGSAAEPCVPVRARFGKVETDILIYRMMQPSGLAILGFATVIPFIFWRVPLGKSFSGVGFVPLAVGYASAALGLLIVAFTSSYFDFSKRVSIGLLQEGVRWSIVPGWTIYLALLMLVVVLPLLAAVGVPLAVLLIRRRMLNFSSIAVVAITIWLGLTVVFG